MNYYAHGRPFIDDPYMLAGTAVPDWLGVVNRRIKARSKAAQTLTRAADPEVAAIARGVIQHHHDDRWFHNTEVFHRLNLQFARQIRAALPDAEGLRPSFLGHILVELLLDAELIGESPERLDAYYHRLQSVDAEKVSATISRMTGRDASGLSFFIGRFLEVRFLSDYWADDTMLLRLNQVMCRVKLPALPASFTELLPSMRRAVRQHKAELMTPSKETLF